MRGDHVEGEVFEFVEHLAELVRTDAFGERREPDEVDESDDEAGTFERVDALRARAETTDRGFGVEAEQGVEPGADPRALVSRARRT